MVKRWWGALALVTLVATGLTAIAAPAGAKPGKPAVPPAAAPLKGTPFEPGVVLVGYAPGAQAADVSAAHAALAATAVEPVSPLATDVEKITLGTGVTIEGARKALGAVKGIRFVEPNYLLAPTATSDDPYVVGGNLWGMAGNGTSPANTNGSQAAVAWSADRTGSRSVVVGIVDEGIQVNHPDLAANIWVNPGEVAGNGVDDDANGYVDDVNGYDFANNDGTVYDGAVDDHGTHVAGTIGALGGNGVGVAGVNWSVTMISAKFLGAGGGTTANAIRAIDYLTDLKARYGLDLVATNNSWGGGGFSQALLDAIERGADRDIVFVAAAGNTAANNDTNPIYPASYRCTAGGTRGWDCVISVAAIDSAGSLATFSGYGTSAVDLGAPGVNIYSTMPDATYGALSGTSMATPHVTGALAACAAANPSLGGAARRAAVTGSTVPTRSLAGRVVNGGRLDINRMLRVCTDAGAAPVGSPATPTAASLTPSLVRVQWADQVSGELGYEVQRASGSGGACGTFATVARIGADTREFFDGGLAGSSLYCYRTRAVGSTAVTAWSANATVTTLDPPIPYACAADAFAWLDPAGGTRLALGDDAAAGVNLPFPFAFYGTGAPSVSVSSNGYLRFGAGAATAYANTAIPAAAEPNAIAAPWWDDLNPAIGGSVWTHVAGTAPNRSFVATWLGVPVYGVAGSAISFQAVLEEGTGAIRFQYLDAVAGAGASDNGKSATIGTEDALGAAATQIGFNQAMVTDRSALRCRPVGAAVSVTTTAVAAGTVGTDYRHQFTATGGTGAYTWAVSAGVLPAGLLLDGATGAITGVPTVSGSSSFTVAATDGAGARATRSFTLTVGDAVSVPSSVLAAATYGQAYSHTLKASGGSGTYTWAVSAGALPAGLSLAASSGVLSGTPADPATTAVVPFTVTATDSAGRIGSAELNLSVAPAVSVTTVDLSQGFVGSSFDAVLTATGGQGSYGWSVSSGALPDGLALGSDGLLSGVPTKSQRVTFTVTALDGEGRKGSKSFTMTVAAAAVPSSFNKSSPRNGATGVAVKATLSWQAATGASSYEYCIDTTNNNTCDSGNWVSVGTALSAALPGLAVKTTYFWQVRAVNPSGWTGANNNGWWKLTTVSR